VRHAIAALDWPQQATISQNLSSPFAQGPLGPFTNRIIQPTVVAGVSLTLEFLP
jgi:hypothetical protein